MPNRLDAAVRDGFAIGFPIGRAVPFDFWEKWRRKKELHWLPKKSHKGEPIGAPAVAGRGRRGLTQLGRVF